MSSMSLTYIPPPRDMSDPGKGLWNVLFDLCCFLKEKSWSKEKWGKSEDRGHTKWTRFNQAAKIINILKAEAPGSDSILLLTNVGTGVLNLPVLRQCLDIHQIGVWHTPDLQMALWLLPEGITRPDHLTAVIQIIKHDQTSWHSSPRAFGIHHPDSF